MEFPNKLRVTVYRKKQCDISITVTWDPTNQQWECEIEDINVTVIPYLPYPKD